VLHSQAVVGVVRDGVTEVQVLLKVELLDKQDLSPAMVVATLVLKAQLVEYLLLMPQRYIRVQVYTHCKTTEILNQD
jgi:hypothetical protein